MDVVSGWCTSRAPPYPKRSRCRRVSYQSHRCSSSSTAHTLAPALIFSRSDTISQPDQDGQASHGCVLQPQSMGVRITFVAVTLLDSITNSYSTDWEGNRNRIIDSIKIAKERGARFRTVCQLQSSFLSWQFTETCLKIRPGT